MVYFKNQVHIYYIRRQIKTQHWGSVIQLFYLIEYDLGNLKNKVLTSIK